MLPHTINEIASKQLATGIYITDFGDAVLTDSENLALSIMKAIGSSTFEVLTETAGWTFSPIASYFAKPVQKVLPKKFFTEFDKLVSSRYGVAASEALRKYGYDGILEEMGEDEIRAKVSEIAEKLGVEKSMKSMGVLMKSVMAELKDKADGSAVNKAVKEFLSSK